MQQNVDLCTNRTEDDAKICGAGGEWTYIYVIGLFRDTFLCVFLHLHCVSVKKTFILNNRFKIIFVSFRLSIHEFHYLSPHGMY